jgi:Leucine-rich repeat (LRR) protein
MGGRKVEDGKEEAARKKTIEYIVDSLLLNSNQIRDIKGLASVLTFVLPHGDPTKLLWLNLSQNYLDKIDDEILKFPNLKSLQLHGCYISDIEEVRKLKNMGCL